MVLCYQNLYVSTTCFGTKCYTLVYCRPSIRLLPSVIYLMSGDETITIDVVFLFSLIIHCVSALGPGDLGTLGKTCPYFGIDKATLFFICWITLRKLKL